MKTINRCLIAFMMFFAAALYAEDGVKDLVNTCVACHGAEGISANDLWPDLAGQQTDYLAAEMKAFRDGKRVDPLMSASMYGFSDEQILSMANYYADLAPVRQTATTINEAGRNVRARCVSCHGMTGNTVTSLWPNLAGQKTGYLKKQLMDFKNGTRKGPLMEVIAKELSDEEIANVAEYFSQI